MVRRLDSRECSASADMLGSSRVRRGDSSWLDTSMRCRAAWWAAATETRTSSAQIDGFSPAVPLAGASRMRRGLRRALNAAGVPTSDNVYYVKSTPFRLIIQVLSLAFRCSGADVRTWVILGRRDLRLSKPVPTPRKVVQADQKFRPIYEGAIFSPESRMKYGG